jgi:hypothetical protein
MAEIKHKWTEQGIVIMLRRQVAGLTQEKHDMLRQHRGRIPKRGGTWFRSSTRCGKH